jgi:chaperonin cofactor prefoldin
LLPSRLHDFQLSGILFAKCFSQANSAANFFNSSTRPIGGNMKKQRMKAVALSTVISAGALLAGAAQANENLNGIASISQSKIDAARASQVRINKLQDETSDLITQYKQENKQIDSLRVYNKQLENQLNAQLAALSELDEAIANVTVIQREVPPLIIKMLDAMEQFVKLDAPYKQELRLERIAKQRDNLDSAKITVAEKFRQVVELYNIESEYARKVDTYTDTITVDGQTIDVSILAVGRVSLMFQTADRSVTGAWDRKLNAWVVLPPDEFADTVNNGIRMAQKKASNGILALPVQAPEAAQ